MGAASTSVRQPCHRCPEPALGPRLYLLSVHPVGRCLGEFKMVVAWHRDLRDGAPHAGLLDESNVYFNAGVTDSLANQMLSVPR